MSRILFVSTSTTLGGAEKTLFTLATSLDPRRHSVAGAVSLKPGGHYARLLQERGIKTESLNLARAAPWDARRLAAIIARERPDVVHAFLYQAIQLTRLAKPLAGCPFKLISSPRVHYRSRSRWSLLLDRCLRDRDDLLVAESEASRRFLVQDLGYAPSKTVAILNGVCLPDAPPPDLRRHRREELGLSEGDVLLGAVGRLDPQKGFSTLIEAIALMKASRVRAAILGEGPERRNLEALLRARGLQDSIRLLGERADAESWRAAFDIFCLPSLWEGLPNALLEAMAAGLPIVASNVDGVPEAVADGAAGLLVPPGRPRELAHALETLAADPAKRSSLGAAAQAAVRERFLLSRMIADYDRVYAASP